VLRSLPRLVPAARPRTASAARKEDPHCRCSSPGTATGPGTAPPPRARGRCCWPASRPPHAARHGVTIQAEALLDDQHLLLLIVQAPSPQAVHQFLAFLPAPATCRYCPPAPP